MAAVAKTIPVDKYVEIKIPDKDDKGAPLALTEVKWTITPAAGVGLFMNTDGQSAYASSSTTEGDFTIDIVGKTAAGGTGTGQLVLTVQKEVTPPADKDQTFTVLVSDPLANPPPATA